MKKSHLAMLLLAVAGLAVNAQAQYDEDRKEAPQSGVARLSLIHGDVSMQRGDSGDWAATTLNTPLVRGDTIATGDKSRAEIQLDYANILRLSSRSQVKLADVTRTRIQIQLSQGYANYTMFKGTEADVEIDTPNVAIRLLKHGRYRIQVNSDSETDVIARDGEAEITTPQGSTTLKEGQLITIRGTDNPEYKVSEAPGNDDWDRFNKDRDSIIRNAEGWRRTNQYYTGANDLDAYGHWVFVPGYGYVWSPYQGASWAPYQTGRWVWEPYYGWTWVSYEPWGWAPYHYGRWFVYANSWYWWPGPVHPRFRPVWAPAYVFFIGFGHRSSFGFGSIGWLPCGPHDYFYPWYGRGFNRINVVNVTNINVTNINVVNRGAVLAPLAGRGRGQAFSNVNMAMTNVRVRQAITTVPAQDFGKGTAAHRYAGVDAQTFKQAQVVAGNLPVVPTRESLQPTNKGLTPATAGINVRNSDHFFVRNQPPANQPRFQDQANRVQEVIQAHGGGAQATVRTDSAAAAGGKGAEAAVNASGSTQGSGANNAGNGRMNRAETGMAGKPGADVSGAAAAGVNRPSGNSSTQGGGVGDSWSRFGRNGTGPQDAGRVNAGGRNTDGAMKASGGSASATVTANEAQKPQDSTSNSGSGKPAGQGQSNANSDKSGADKSNGRYGWHTFSGAGAQGDQHGPPANNGGAARHESPAATQTPGSGNSAPGGNAAGGNAAGSNSGGGNRDGSFHPFTPQPRGQSDTGGSPRNQGGMGNTPSGRTSTDSRPPLQINRPIVTPRSDGNGGGRPAPPSHVDNGGGRMGPPSHVDNGGAGRVGPPSVPHSEPRSSGGSGGSAGGGGSHGGGGNSGGGSHSSGGGNSGGGNHGGRGDSKSDHKN